MIAHQTAAKAARDAFFLSEFSIDWLPLMVISAAVLSIGVALGMSRLLSQFGPARLVPGVFAGSSALTLVEWGFAPVAPGPVAIAFYLHVASFGAVLISNF